MKTASARPTHPQPEREVESPSSDQRGSTSALVAMAACQMILLLMLSA